MKYSELKTLVNAIDNARKDNNTLKSYTLDKYLVDSTTKQVVKTQFVLVSENECEKINADEDISRIRFQIVDENTKRNSTVYIKLRDKVFCECSLTFLQNYKLAKYETRKTFKANRADEIVTDYEHLSNTISNLLALHNIKLVFESTAQKTSTSKKRTAKKAQ